MIAVLVASILISVTYIMFSITLKQVTLSTVGKNSQVALYAADTGVECGLFAEDNITNEFAVPTTLDDGNGNTTVTLGQRVPDPFNCNGESVSMTPGNGTVTVGGTTYPALTTTFYVHYVNDTPCALVTISKDVVNRDSTTQKPATKIESRGYNTCPDVTAVDPLRFERGLEVYF